MNKYAYNQFIHFRLLTSMAILSIHQLYKTYSNGIEALKGIDLTVDKGDFFALLGANGAGKSTTIGLITTLIKKTSGDIVINGYNLDNHPEKAKTFLGVVPQEFNLNIFENCEQILLNQAGYYGISRHEVLPHVHHLLHQLGLWEKRHSIVRQLSGGMKRRLMIARALVHKPTLLILDEPTAGVDVEIRRSMWEFLRKANQEGTTIILTTHYLEEAEQLCKNVAIIDNGKIIRNDSMSSILKTINYQTFILNTARPMGVLPEINDFSMKLIDEHTLEIKVDQQMSLNDVFRLLDLHHIQIHSLRNKTNRLEELFLDLINHDH